MSTPAVFGAGRYISGIPVVLQPDQFVSNVDTLYPRWIQEGLQQPTYILRLSSDASRELRGLDVLPPGALVWFFNAGTQSIVIVNESAAAEERYRFVNATGANATIVAGSIFPVIRDGVTNRWRLDR